MKNVLIKIKDNFLKVWNNKFFSIVAVRYILLGLALNIFIESLCHLSLWEALVFMVLRPHIFLINLVEVVAIVSLGAFFKKRAFATFMFSLPLVFLGVLNGILMAIRHTPLTLPDFLDAKEAFLVLPNFMNPFQIGLVVLFILAMIAGIVFMAIKTPTVTKKINYFKCIAFSSICFALAFGSNYFGSMSGILESNFGNIKQAYFDNGFAYCFTASIFGFGVDRPSDYSGEVVDDLVGNLGGEKTTEAETTPNEDPSEEKPTVPEVTEKKPNILFVQLESLFDPTHIKGATFSEDPLPTLHQLYKNYSSGYLSVPSYGGGTANSEFEVISGMNMDHFGPGEYPYKTVLMGHSCETIAYYLKDLGYTTFALHNNEGDFYARNEVFPNLGFDYFTSIEFISDYTTTEPYGWAKDDCLTQEILAMLDTTPGQDFIYTISVQSHGEYPDNIDGMDFSLSATDENDATGNLNGLIYYVNQIHEDDIFVATLIEELSKRDEETILVLYGDHLPPFDLSADELTNEDIYQTQYVVWSNMNLPKENRDIEAYQLSSMVLHQANLTGNLIFRLHEAQLYNNFGTNEKYLENLQLLEYDILYGNCDAYDGVFPYERTDMQYGYKPIVVKTAKNVYSHISLRGANFTAWSRVYINGNLCKTLYNGPHELIVDEMQLKDGDEIVIKQQCVSGLYISENEPIIYHE